MGHQAGAAPDLRKAYFMEKRRRWTMGFLWRSFRGLVAKGNPGLPAVRAPDFGDGHLAWADGLADYYANLYRSSFILNYLFSAVAALLALLPFALGWTDHEHPLAARQNLFSAAELLVIFAILANTITGIRRQWHERWIDYRLLAEYLRQIQFLAPLGRLSLYSNPATLPTPANPKSTWMCWLAQAAAREAGMGGAAFDERSILFPTLEPCAPDSRHPPKMSRTERIALSRIKEVWVGQIPKTTASPCGSTYPSRLPASLTQEEGLMSVGVRSALGQHLEADLDAAA